VGMLCMKTLGNSEAHTSICKKQRMISPGV
jgi:hypothetical protein